MTKNLQKNSKIILLCPKLCIALFITIGLIFSSQNILANLFNTPVAMITSVAGKVTFENSTERQIDFGTDIYIGDLIKTNTGATVSLTFYSGCRQEVIDQKSLVQVGRSQSVIRNGQFKQQQTLDCEVPKAVLEASDSHLKAGLTVRSVTDNDPITELKKLINKNSFPLKAWTNNGNEPVYKIGEAILLHFITNQDAYIAINYYSSNGELYHLTMDLMLDNSKITSGKLYSIGNSNSGLIAGSPAGSDFIHVIASDKPILINDQINKAKKYYSAVESFIHNNPTQQFSEQIIKLTITQ